MTAHEYRDIETTMAREPNEASKTKKRPSFFKIMYGDFRNALKLPLAFTERFETELKTKSILKDPTGTRWYVKVKKIEDHLFILNNWPRFVESNSLQYGDVLIFTYIGDSRFNVKIYDRTECEKDLSLAKNVSLEQRDDLQRGGESAPVAVNAHNNSNQMGVSGKSTVDSRGKGYQINGREYSCHKKAYQVNKIHETRRPSMEMSRQCDNPSASERSATKCRPANIESSTVKRRKLSSENALLSEEQGRNDICLGRPNPRPRQSSLQKPKRAAEISKERELYQGEAMDSATEIILVDSDSESEEMTNNLEASVPSCVTTRAASLVDEETESHSSEMAYRNENADELDSPIQDEALVLPTVEKGSHPMLCAEMSGHVISPDEMAENPSYEIHLSHCYIFRSFVHVPMKLRRCLSKIAVGESGSGSGRETVRLWISDDRSWSVRFTWTRTKSYFCSGWKKFTVENNLVEGDVCIFQLMKTGKLDLAVSVRRLHQQLPLPA